MSGVTGEGGVHGGKYAAGYGEPGLRIVPRGCVPSMPGPRGSSSVVTPTTRGARVVPWLPCPVKIMCAGRSCARIFFCSRISDSSSDSGRGGQPCT